MERLSKQAIILKSVIQFFAVYILIFAWLEFEAMAWGTGNWLGELSLKWTFLLAGFTLFFIICFITATLFLWYPHRLETVAAFLVNFRERLGIIRWPLIAVVLIAPVWLLQYTVWGVVVYKPFLRLEIWALCLMLSGILFSRRDVLINWNGFIVGLILSAGILVIARPLQNVTDYPFSLGWSEGNRLWDYSVLFGRELYDYPSDQPIPVLLDIGRQFVGGMPFLLPHVSIMGERLWVALTYILPFLILGWAAFKLPGKQYGVWFLAGIWAYTFLNQGPIHPPLVVCAIFVSLAWRRPLWLAIPLVLLVSYFAHESRWTWMFAPGMWLSMLELAGAKMVDGKLTRQDWLRASTLGLSGFLGGYVAPFLVSGIINKGAGGFSGATTIETMIAETGTQPLLWYRLLPNATYGMGILAALSIAIAPLIIVLVYYSKIDRWLQNPWQKLIVVAVLLAFLVVGLIVSVKIGGGGDLHNMDMFIIGLMFSASIAWQKGGKEWLSVKPSSGWLAAIVISLIAIPAYQPLVALQPLAYAEQLGWVMTLRDDHSVHIVNSSLASDVVVDRALDTLKSEIDLAKPQGDILFMDQRQLLTFGYIDATLIPEYDKKVLINNAMSEDRLYFNSFYRDLASHRFSLIITNPLNERIKDSSYQFGEENNAWVEWVSIPVLCYYETKATLREVDIQLLIPRSDAAECSSVLP